MRVPIIVPPVVLLEHKPEALCALLAGPLGEEAAVQDCPKEIAEAILGHSQIQRVEDQLAGALDALRQDLQVECGKRADLAKLCEERLLAIEALQYSPVTIDVGPPSDPPSPGVQTMPRNPLHFVTIEGGRSCASCS